MPVLWAILGDLETFPIKFQAGVATSFFEQIEPLKVKYCCLSTFREAMARSL